MQPFVDEGHFFHQFFPARELAIIIPASIGAFAFLVRICIIGAPRSLSYLFGTLFLPRLCQCCLSLVNADAVATLLLCSS